MARTRTEWNALVLTSLTDAGLSPSGSVVAIWLHLRNLVVTLAMAFEAILEVFKSDTEYSLDTKEAGVLTWYAKVILEFQYGDSLTVIDGLLKYAIIDPTKRIITHRSVIEAGGVVSIRVAKTVGGNVVPLTNPEFAAFVTYMEAKRFPGTIMNLYSLAADSVAYTITVFKKLTYEDTAIVANIEAALELYRDHFPFNGVFYASQFVKAINDAEGVEAVGSYDIDIALSAGGAANNLTDHVALSSGYFDYDPVSAITILPAL